MIARQGEQGSALILALVFLSLFGLAIAALLTFSDTGVRATLALAGQGKTVYSADGGVEAAINVLRLDQTRGREGGACPDLRLANTNSVTVTVTCAPMPGSGVSSGSGSQNRPKRAILTLGTHAQEEGLEQLSNSGLRIHGGVFSNSTIVNTASASVLTIEGGTDAYGNCSVAGGGAGTIVAIPGPLHCSNIPPPPAAGDPDGLDPNYAAATSTVPTYRTAPSCAPAIIALEPGYYDDATALSNLTTGGSCKGRVVWFRPGVYYFDFDFRNSNAVWSIDDKDVNIVGGTPKGWDPLSATRPTVPFPEGCKTDADPSPNPGVQFIFGSASRVEIEAGTVELCPQPSDTSQQIAVYGLKSGSAAASSVTLVPTAASSVVGFTNTQNAFAIDGVTSSATLAGSGAVASMRLGGYPNPMPAGSKINSATLRVTHQEVNDGDFASVGLVLRPGGGGTTNLTGTKSPTLHQDSFNVASTMNDASKFDGLAVDFTGTLKNGSSRNGTERLDGVELVINYTAPAFRAQSGCLVAQPYPSSGCAFISTNGSQSNLALKGTLYAPRAAIDLALTNVASQILGRGSISRILRLSVTPSSSFIGPTVSLPDSGSLSNREVVLTAFVEGVPRLRAHAAFADYVGGVLDPDPEVTIKSWSVLR